MIDYKHDTRLSAFRLSGLPDFRTNSHGFTFIEILATMVFMAIAIPAIIEGLTLANRAGLVAQRKRVAAQLVDARLSELIVTGQWHNGNQSGNFGADHPGYRWAVKSAAWQDQLGLLTMSQVSVQVWYTVQGREYEVHLATLVDGSVNST